MNIATNIKKPIELRVNELKSEIRLITSKETRLTNEERVNLISLKKELTNAEKILNPDLEDEIEDLPPLNAEQQEEMNQYVARIIKETRKRIAKEEQNDII